MCSPVEHYVCFYLIFFLYEIEMSPGKIVFGVVPSKNDNRCPRKSSLSSLYYRLLCLPICRARCLSFRLKLSRMATLMERVILLFVCVVGKMLLFFNVVFFFPPGVYVGTLNLIASIPGPSIFTLLHKSGVKGGIHFTDMFFLSDA